jgi:hypothetical protein
MTKYDESIDEGMLIYLFEGVAVTFRHHFGVRKLGQLISPEYVFFVTFGKVILIFFSLFKEIVKIIRCLIL